MASRRATLPDGSTPEGSEAKRAFSQVRSLLMLIIRSGEFRSIMKESVSIIQGIMAGGKQVSLKGDRKLASNLRDLAIKMSQNPEYKAVSEKLLGIFGTFKQGTYFARDALVSQDLLITFDQMWDEGTAIVQEFFGVEGPTIFSQELLILYVTAYNDPAAMSVLREFRSFFEEAVRNPQVLNDEAKMDHAVELINRARIILRSDPYKIHMRRLLEGAKIMIHYLSNDPLSCELAGNIAKLVADIGFDAQGRPDLFAIADSLNQIKLLLIPVITKELSNFPVPRITSSDAKMEMTIENILVETRDILPAIFDIEAKSRSRVAAYSMSNQHFATILRVSAEGIKPYFDNVYFYFRRKVFPRVSDEGIVQIDFTKGPGISLDIQWILESAGPELPLELHLYKVKCRVANLRLKFEQTRYRFIENAMTRLFATQIRRQIALSIVKKLTQALEGINIKLNQILLKKPQIGVTNKLNESMKAMLKKKSKAERKPASTPQTQLPQSNVPVIRQAIVTQQTSVPIVISSVPSYVINEIKPLNLPTASFQPFPSVSAV